MSSSPEPGMWQQFRRRRVTRSVVTYLAIAFLVVEASWYLTGMLGLPEALGRVVLGAAVIGFPLAVVLAWTYDLTPEGIIKTPDELSADASEGAPSLGGVSRWWVFPAGAVLAGVIIQWFRT